MITQKPSDVYTDINGLSQLKHQLKNNSEDSIKEVAKQFESVFVNMMLKSMRQVQLAEGILDNRQSEFFREMYDQQLSVHLSGEQGIGLSAVIERQLKGLDHVKGLDPIKIQDYPRRTYLRNMESTAPVQVEPQPETVQPIHLKNHPDQFIDQLKPAAKLAAAELNVDPGVLLAQAALETGWGRFVIKNSDGSSSHNLFNIKAHNGWKGKTAETETIEYKQGVPQQEKSRFRSYASFQQSFADYVNFIQSNPRYQTALTVSEDPKKYITELQRAGYATDPNYARKVNTLYHQIEAHNSRYMAQDETGR